MRKVKVLFVIKKKIDSYGQSYGLNNSAKFVVQALDLVGINSEIEFVVDGNDINRVVTLHKPEVVIIEALWVTPEKIEELSGIHKRVTWVVRVHSKIPFLSTEGMAVEWIKKYIKLNKVIVSFNNAETNDNFKDIISNKVKYLPNIYIKPVYTPCIVKNTHDHIIDIGCFGAIRPLKNQLLQAFAAIKFAEEIGKELHFHINGNRIEQKGECIHRNIKSLFEGSSHKLIEIPWMDHYEFMKVIGNMDINLQVSYSESFNIVSADSYYTGSPAVVSNEIDWVHSSVQVKNINSVDNIVDKLFVAYENKDYVVRETLGNLEEFNYLGLRRWIKFLNKYL